MNQLLIDVYRWCIGLVGSGAILVSSKIICSSLLSKNGVSKKIIIEDAKLGRISLGIYILNSYTSIYWLPKIADGYMPHVLIWIVETTISMAVYFGVVMLLKKIPIISSLFLGERGKSE